MRLIEWGKKGRDNVHGFYIQSTGCLVQGKAHVKQGGESILRYMINQMSLRGV